MRELLPDLIENNSYKYILVNNKYVISLYIKDYPKESGFLEILDSLPKDFIYDISINISKENTTDILKRLSYQISYLNSELKTVNKNQIDSDILELSSSDAKKLRKDIQVNNEEVFKVSFYITFFHEDLNKLNILVKDFQNKLYSKQIISNISNFRHLNSYLNSFPYINKYKNLSISSNYMTTNTLANIFPFYSRSLLDKGGIIIGNIEQENKICILDIFSKKYFNSNICIFGSSGSGKSFFAKMYILRQHLSGTRQIIFDPEAEYKNLVLKLNGIYLTSTDDSKYFYNFLEIRKYDLKENFLDFKIKEIKEFLALILNLEKESDILTVEEAIKKSYLDYGITNDINSVYKKADNGNFYIQKELIGSLDFPDFNDVYKNIAKSSIKKKFKDRVLDNFTCFSKKSNISDKYNLIGVDLKYYDTRDSAILTRYLVNKINQEIDISVENKTLFYFDEAWKYMKSSLKENISDLIFSMYKTIRKKNAGIILITQDISDLFMSENIEYAKSILNNSEFKFFFKLEYSDIDIIRQVGSITKYDIDQIARLKKGYCYLMFDNNKATLKISVNELENDLIKGGDLYDNYST